MRTIIAPVILSHFVFVSPKDSFRFNLFHLNRRNRQTDSVPSQNWSSLIVMDVRARVCIVTTHQRENKTVLLLNRLATHRVCAIDPLQMIGSRALVIINFALFLHVFFSCLVFLFFFFLQNHWRLQGFYLSVWSQAILADGQAVTYIHIKN